MEEAEIQQLLSAFESQSLTKEAWTHEAHLLVACCYLHLYTREEALIYLRSGIISLNVAMGVKNTPTSGYHETMTQFWVWVIDRFLSRQSETSSLAELCQRFLESPCANKALPLTFYSKDFLLSTSARASWVEPDKQALDEKYLSFK